MRTGVNRKNREELGEVFTPDELVDQILDNLDPELFTNPEKTFCDPTCGNGQFLYAVLQRKMANGIDHRTALLTIFGVDINPDNVNECRERLLMNDHRYTHIVNQNIKVADATTYDFEFDK